MDIAAGPRRYQCSQRRGQKGDLQGRARGKSLLSYQDQSPSVPSPLDLMAPGTWTGRQSPGF